MEKTRLATQSIQHKPGNGAALTLLYHQNNLKSHVRAATSTINTHVAPESYKKLKKRMEISSGREKQENLLELDRQNMRFHFRLAKIANDGSQYSPASRKNSELHQVGSLNEEARTRFFKKINMENSRFATQLDSSKPTVPSLRYNNLRNEQAKQDSYMRNSSKARVVPDPLVNSSLSNFSNAFGTTRRPSRCIEFSNASCQRQQQPTPVKGDTSLFASTLKTPLDNLNQISVSHTNNSPRNSPRMIGLTEPMTNEQVSPKPEHATMYFKDTDDFSKISKRDKLISPTLPLPSINRRGLQEWKNLGAHSNNQQQSPLMKEQDSLMQKSIDRTRGTTPNEVLQANLMKPFVRRRNQPVSQSLQAVTGKLVEQDKIMAEQAKIKQIKLKKIISNSNNNNQDYQNLGHESTRSSYSKGTKQTIDMFLFGQFCQM